MSRVTAPWTDDQVASLAAYQQAGHFHPFTGTRQSNGDETTLIPTPAGWIEHEGGPVVQARAHDFMTNWSYNLALDSLRTGVYSYL